jgi:hypothetical protein
VGGIRVEVHEPADVLSTMLLALAGGPREAKPHPIAADALEHIRPFRNHPSIAWLREFASTHDLVGLYGHAAQLAGPVSFAPRSRQVPAYLRGYEPQRMKELPARLATFCDDAKIGAFRRAHVAEYTLAEADVRDALDGAAIDAFLRDLYGPVKYALVVAPVPTHPRSGGGTGAASPWESFAFLRPPRVAASSPDPVAWSSDPEGTQVLAQHELSHALFDDAMREHGELVARLAPVLARVPPDAPLARVYRDADRRLAELFIRGSSVSYLRRTHGDEPAQRWLDGQARRLGTPLVRDFFLAIEAYLAGRRWSDLHAFLADLPTALGA